MSNKELFEKHLGYHKKNLESLKEYAKTQGDYIAIRDAKDEYNLEFRVASQWYVLQAEFHTQEDKTEYKTYKIERDLQHYGNWKLTPVHELDMSIDFGGYTLLKEKRTIQQKAAIGTNSVPIDRLNPFGEDYILVLLSES